MPRRILLDVDTGTDDALAILYALGHPELEVLGISCVAGNVPIDQVVINTCKVLDAAGATGIPVAAGAFQPLLESARRTGKSHGVDGLGGIRLPATSRQRSPRHAVELLHQLIMASTQRLTLVTLAPKTNVALLLTMYPEVTTRLDHIIFMGGATAGGNVTALAEFNVWQDPEAAQCVIQSAVPITLYGLEAFSRLTVDRADADRFRAHGHSAVRLAGDLLYQSAEVGGVESLCGFARRCRCFGSAHQPGTLRYWQVPRAGQPRGHRPRADNYRSASWATRHR